MDLSMTVRYTEDRKRSARNSLEYDAIRYNRIEYFIIEENV